MIPLFYPYIPKKKILEEISDTLNSRWIGQGPKVELFEREFGKKMGYKYPVMVNSGTSALELAYHLLDLKKGDVVVVPVLDAVSGQVGLIRRRCKIRFCDIEKSTLNINPLHLEKLLNRDRVKAVVGVHLGGIHFHQKINLLCKKFKVPLIVDSAQYHAKTEGDYICYSFQAIKHITTADGGMLVLNNKKEYEKAKELRWFGIPRKFKKSWRQRAVTLGLKEAGYKYQPTDIDACFALAALPDLDGVIEYRKQLAIEYKKGLEKVKEIQIVAGDTYWLLTIFAKKRNQLANYLAKRGIETNLVHIRNDKYKILSNKRQNLPDMDWIEKRYLCLPLNCKIKKTDVKYICRSIRNFYGQT
jgi:perosamine synthetase